MKKELMQKIVNTVVNTMFTCSHDVDKVQVSFEKASKYGLAASISNCFKYVETRRTGHKADIVLAYTDYDNAINIYTTVHTEENVCKGYSYRFAVRTDNKNQIEVTAELCLALSMVMKEVY